MTEGTDGSLLTVEGSTLIRTGDKVRMWTQTYYKAAAEGGAWRIVALDEWDCATRQNRTLDWTSYGKDGATIQSRVVKEPSAWRHVPPDTVGEALLQFACAKDRTKFDRYPADTTPTDIARRFWEQPTAPAPRGSATPVPNAGTLPQS